MKWIGKAQLDKGFAILKGFFLRLFFPHKTLILIHSSMRSGSTLLKALLGTAPDVSHIGEYKYKKEFFYKYHLYLCSYFLSKKRIIVLKDPMGYRAAKIKYKIPKTSFIKNIVIVRDVYETATSLVHMNKEVNIAKTKEEVVNYWCGAYENILRCLELSKKNTYTIRYEDLLRNPEDITKKLFNFIGSCQTTGVSSYRSYGGWEWNKDDGGEKIKSLKVKKPNNFIRNDSELINIIQSSRQANFLRSKYGYI